MLSSQHNLLKRLKVSRGVPMVAGVTGHLVRIDFFVRFYSLIVCDTLNFRWKICMTKAMTTVTFVLGPPLKVSIVTINVVKFIKFTGGFLSSKNAMLFLVVTKKYFLILRWCEIRGSWILSDLLVSFLVATSNMY